MPHSVSESILAAMRQTNQLFDAEVVGKQNFDALDGVYTAHARVLPPGAPMIEGREQIKGFWKQAVGALGATSAKLSTVNAEASGDGVLEIGRADLTVAGGQIVTVKYVVYWKQEDGAWKWNVDIWNLNQ
jgi:ketosteroid isomerase-like protein